MFFVIERPVRGYVPVCMEYIFSIFGVEVLMLELSCILFLCDVLPLPRWIFSPDCGVVMDKFDLVVFVVLTAEVCILFATSYLLLTNTTCHTM